MRKLMLLVGVLALAGPLGMPYQIPVMEARPLDVRQMLIDAAKREGIDPAPVLKIAVRESGMDPTAVHCCNYDGTRDWGVMQLNDYVVKHLKVKNPLDAEENIRVGVQIWAGYVKKGWGMDWAHCAYAKGPGNCPR